MKNYLFIVITTVLSFGINNTIAMDSHEAPLPNNINGNNNKEQDCIFIIKNEFLNTYIEELTESIRNLCSYYVENNKKISNNIIETANINVNKVLNIVLKDTVDREGIRNIRECIRNLNKEYTEDTILNAKLYRVVLNCHSILNELTVQRITNIMDMI